jgi:uncharacterized membrane protein YdbT with pleckstrin-like domain
MSYVSTILQPGEKLLVDGRLHWIGYWRAIACFVVAALPLFIFHPQSQAEKVTLEAFIAVFVVAGLLAAAHVAWLRWGTEVGVTDRRVIYKHGVISRRTAEMNMDKIETVQVDQSLLGRILDYGAITIKGSGASIETLRYISEPIALRSAITAR